MRYAAAAVALLAVGLTLGWMIRDAPPAPLAPTDPPAARVDPLLASLDAAQGRLRARLAQLREPTAAEEARLRRPATAAYGVHLDRAEALGVPPLTGEAALDDHLAAGRLVPLVDTEHYVVRVLEHSKPFVTPLLARRLAEVGDRFHAALAEAGLPPLRFTISSALRTADLQEALGESNRNAAVGRSSHEYGASADLVYTRFAGPLRAPALGGAPEDPALATAQALADRWATDLAGAYSDRLFGALARVLHAMQEAERLVVLLEDEQPVFHVTTDRG